MNRCLHIAKLLVTNDLEHLTNGAFLVENSKIVSVGKIEDFGELNTEIINHGDSLICPGFINLHTHLLYSKSGQINGSGGLFPWLENLIAKTKDWQESDHLDSINYGINKALSTGTTFIVENTPSALSVQELSKSSLKALVGLEVFGSDEEKADGIFEDALEYISNCHSRLDRESSLTTDIDQSPDSHFHGNDMQRINFTFSPHAPYDVSKPLWEKLINWSNENNKPLLTHLEESPEERLWWKEKVGKGIDFWKSINKLESKLKHWKKYNSGIDFLSKNNLLSRNIIGTHLCQAIEADLKLLQEKNITLVHCPRSNFYLNNGTANLKLWNELGLIWGIGTDSIASNENLDLLEELRFTINHQKSVCNYTLPSKKAFEAITSTAAKIISKEHEIGYLKKDYYADFLVYDIKDKSASTYKDPYNLLIFNINNNKNLKEVWINGQKAWKREAILNKI